MKRNPTRAAWAATFSAFVTITGDASATDPTNASATDLASTSAREAPPTDTTDVAEPPNWLIGAGVQTMEFSYGLGGLAGEAGGGAAFGVVPFLYGLGVERRLSESLWLFARGSANANHYESGGDTPSESTSFTVGATVGVRPVVNPNDRIQLSFPISMSGNYNAVDGTFTRQDYETGVISEGTQRTRGWSARAEAGVAVDFWVARQVALRLHSNVLAVGHDHWSNQGASSNAWFGGLQLQPSFAVMVGF